MVAVEGGIVVVVLEVVVVLAAVVGVVPALIAEVLVVVERSGRCVVLETFLPAVPHALAVTATTNTAAQLRALRIMDEP